MKRFREGQHDRFASISARNACYTTRSSSRVCLEITMTRAAATFDPSVHRDSRGDHLFVPWLRFFHQ